MHINHIFKSFYPKIYNQEYYNLYIKYNDYGKNFVVFTHSAECSIIFKSWI